MGEVVRWSDDADDMIKGDVTAAAAYLTPAGGTVVTAVAPCGIGCDHPPADQEWPGTGERAPASRHMKRLFTPEISSCSIALKPNLSYSATFLSTSVSR
jgi:hypothetical protein